MSRTGSTYIRVLAATSLCLSLQGCMVGPDYQRPTAALNPDWLEQETLTFPRDRAAVTDWWTVFNDPVLDRLVEIAYRQNLDLEAAGLRVVQARASRGIAVGDFFPQEQAINGNLDNNSISRNETSAGDDRYFATAGLSLDVAWELDFWGKFRRGIETEDAVLLASIAEYDDVLVSLLAEVALTYVDIRTTEVRLELARANVTSQESSLEIADVRFRNGATTELDVTEARSTLANTQSTIPSLEADLRSAKLAMCVLLGRPPELLESELAGSTGIPIAPPEIAVGAPAELLRRRPDVRLAERLAAAQSAQIGVATADLLPSISITGSTGLDTSTADPPRAIGADLIDVVNAQSFSGFIGLVVDWPILNYGRITNNIRVQDAAYQEAVADYRATVLDAAAEVEDALYSFLRTREQYDFLAESAEAAARSLELATTQYTEGSVNFVRVNDANTLLTEQQDDAAQSLGAIAEQLILAYKALGGGWESRVGNEFIPAETAKQMRARTDYGGILDPDDAEGGARLFVPPSAIDETYLNEPDQEN
ncbi:MAG: efflux transporter outer membrane subunit [Planctomycetota bacterium]